MWPGVRSGSSRLQHKATQLGLESGRGWGLWQYCRPSPRLGEATPAFRVRGQGRVLHSRTGRPLAPEIQEWPSMPPLPSLSEQSPTLPPADKPPVPYNQVSLLLCAHSAELNQLPLMVCGLPLSLALGLGEGKPRNELGVGRGYPALSIQTLPWLQGSSPNLFLAWHLGPTAMRPCLFP